MCGGRPAAPSVAARRCTGSHDMSTAPTIGSVDLAGAAARRAASSSASSPLRSSELTVKLGPGDVELAVEPVGDDVRHRAEHPRRVEARADLLPGTLHPVRPGRPTPWTRVASRQRTPKRAASGSTPIPTYTPVDGRRAASPTVCERLGGHLEHGQLLGERGLEIVRREALLGSVAARCRASDPTPASSRHGASSRQRVDERFPPDRAAGVDPDADDGDRSANRLAAGRSAVDRRAPAMAAADAGSSTMRWALLPPKPNADTPARRIAVRRVGTVPRLGLGEQAERRRRR